MFDVKVRRALAAAPVMVAVVALAACAAPSAEKPDDAASDAAAARFVTCLTGEGQTAKILEGGLVGLLLPDAPGDSPLGTVEDGGAIALSEGGGEDAGMTTFSSDADGTWVASTTAAGFPEEGGQRAAWEACEEKVPEFSQPEPDMSAAEGAKTLSLSPDDLIEAGLDFAACARENGYADFADPDADGQITLPAGLTEDEARSLLEACKDSLGDMPPVVDQKSVESLDFDWFALISEYFEGGFMAATAVPSGGDE